MRTPRNTATITGILFIAATASALAASALEPVRTSADYLMGITHQPYRLALSACMYLIAAGTSAGIAIALYPLVRRVSPVLARGAVTFRTVEGVFYTVAVAGLLAVATKAEELLVAVGDTRDEIRQTIEVLLSARDHATLVGVIAFCAGAGMYYIAFYRARLVPRWLSGWGIFGVFMMAIACVAALVSGNTITGYIPFILPILLQEMIFAGWLIVKGVDTSHV